jgi:hypothetical protein
MGKHRLFQVFRQIIWYNKLPLNNALSSSMSTRITVTVHVPLGLLDVVDHLSHSLDVFLFIGRYMLDTRVKPDVFPVRKFLRRCGFVVDLHVCRGSSYGVYRWCWKGRNKPIYILFPISLRSNSRRWLDAFDAQSSELFQINLQSTGVEVKHNG